MRALGYTRQWRYKRDRRMWREDDVADHDFAWCIHCGCYLQDGVKVSAMYCGAACRMAAMRKRRARGVWRGYMKKGAICTGLDLNVTEVRHKRADAFYLCHGKTIDQASAICVRWRESFPDDE